MNIAKAKNNPFDAIILGSTDGIETSCVLKQSNPDLEIIKYTDKESIKTSPYIRLIQDSYPNYLTFAHL